MTATVDAATKAAGVRNAGTPFELPTMRKMTWVKDERRENWACSDCAWIFNPSGPPVGLTLDEMKRNFESQRDKEFGSHVCVDHPRPKVEGLGVKNANLKPRLPRKSDDQR